MKVLRKIYYKLSPKSRRTARRLCYLPIDLYETITNKRNGMIPPRGKIFIGRGDFVTQGEHIKALLTELAGLKPSHSILDIGCGIGRAAVALTSYLDQSGRYEGFDIVKEGIDWCNKKINSRFPNFRFKHIDLRNDLYNLSTDVAAKDFKFPYGNGEFDCAVLTSVFTHMMPEDVDNYLGEIHRVLKTGGKCLATFFILTPGSKSAMKGKEFDFKYSFGDYSLIDKHVKEANVAFEKKFLDKMFAKNDLTVEHTYYGYWSGRQAEGAKDFQDVVILRKDD